MKLVKISLYTASNEISATSYYRVFQYFDNTDYSIKKRTRLSGRLYEQLMPISQKPLYIKTTAFIYMYLRRFLHLLSDCMNTPDVLILSRSLITRIMPPSYRLMLKYLTARGTKIIWDFDDNIIDNKEISHKNFDWISSIASRIVVVGKANMEMLREEYREKAVILPTTDRDMYKLFDKDLIQQRVETLRNEIRLVWVGTSISLPYVKAICPAIEKFAADCGKEVSLTVVCNHPLEYSSINFHLNNIHWTRDVAIKEMKKAHFGIMPLSDKLFNHYKGGFKLIQYLSIGLPVVGSSIGINNDIIRPEYGFKPNALECDEWLKALSMLPSGPDEYAEFSNKAFNQWTENYSYETNRKKWSELVSGILQ